MFLASAVAKDYKKLWSGKLRASYYKKQIMLQLTSKGPRPSPKFTSSFFDESFITVSSSKQVDIHISYYDEKLKRVQRVYLTSQFMGHGTVQDTMNEFN